MLGIPKESSASCFSKDDWGVRRHLEVSVSLLDSVLLFSVHYRGEDTISVKHRRAAAGRQEAPVAARACCFRVPFLPWLTSFSSSSMGLMRVRGQNSRRA